MSRCVSLIRGAAATGQAVSSVPHDIVVAPPLADDVRSVEDGERLVWPLLAETFARVWELPRPPSPGDIQGSLSS